MQVDDSLADLLDHLADRGYPEVEVFHKRGRSRTLRYGHPGQVSSFRQEEGWAVRAGDARKSLFYCGSGAPDPNVTLPEADGRGLRLPSPKPVPSWSAPRDLEAPILGENEARGIFEGLAKELDRELPGARLVRGYLEDGASEEQLVSSREIRSRVRRRSASLFVEAQGARPEAGCQHLLLAEREARKLDPPAIARRLADRLAVADRGVAPRRDRGSFLLGPEIVTALLGSLSQLWIGPGAESYVRPLVDRQGRFGNKLLNLVDDGRLAGGVLDAPVDGEGLPTREVRLVEGGIYNQPLLAWHETQGRQRPSGCCRRASWRDLPRTGPSHLYLKPDPDNSVAALLGDLRRGYYLMTADGGVKVESGFRRFALPVSGFAIEEGRPTGSVTGAWLTGTVTAFLTGILALGRDLTFSVHGNGLLGAPTVLTKGLELRHRF